MSLILDALNRSRNDAQQVPGLATSHHGHSGADGSGLRAWLLPGALVVAVTLIIWLLWERSASPELTTPRAAAPEALQEAAPAAPSPAEPAAPVPDSLPAPAPAPAAVPTPTEIPGPSRLTTTELPEPKSQAPPKEKLADSGTATTTDPGPEAASASASVAALYRQQQLASEEVPASSDVGEVTAPAVARAVEPAAPESMAREEQPIDIEEILEMAEEELENARLAEHPAPFLSALSQQTKDAIPTLLYQAHDYSDTGNDSFVLINGKTLKKGDASKGVRVDEILPDSVVLSFQGTQFRLRALNSWVNL